jgi:hypothetical protein
MNASNENLHCAVLLWCSQTIRFSTLRVTKSVPERMNSAVGDQFAAAQQLNGQEQLLAQRE